MIYNDIRALAVERFKALDIESDAEFLEFVQMASEICGTPIALLTLIDEDIQWLTVKKGTDVRQMPRKTSFCTHTVLADDVLVVPDAQKDERFANSPIVAGGPNIRFYAGTPLVTREGHRVGTLCVIDTEPHELSSTQQSMLKMLGKQAISMMEFRISVELLEENKIKLLKIAHLQAHQFRAPLTTVMGMMNLIKTEDYNPPRQYFELLENAINNLDEKIHEIVYDVDNMAVINSAAYVN